MKSKFIVFLIVLLTSFSQINKAQDGSGHNIRHAIALEFPFNYKEKYHGPDQIFLFQIGWEVNWEPKKEHNFGYSAILLYESFFYSSGSETYREGLLELDFSLLFGKKNHFFELGLGTNNGFIMKAIIGYRLHLGNRFVAKFQVNPYSWFFMESLSGSDYITNFVDFRFGVAYRFNLKVSEAVGFFIHRSYIETQAYLLPFEKDAGSPVPPITFNYGFMPFQVGDFHFGINGGAGFLAGGSPFYQAGIATLYGKDRHFLEAGVNFIFALLRNYNYEHKYSEYVLVQPQLGYRYNFKFPLYLRLAYAPYIRTLDWKRESGLHQNVVFGVGFRFEK